MKFVKLLFLLIFGISLQSLYCYNLPYVDLGLSNFLCGVPFRKDDGWYYLQYVQYYKTNKFLDSKGNLLNGIPSGTYNLWDGISAFTYQSNHRFLGGRIGVIAGIPYFFSSTINNSCLFTSSGKGFGDIFSGAFLQWDLIEYKSRPILWHNLGFIVSFPTGKWLSCGDNISTINPGNNLFFFSPYWAYTFYITPKLTFSGYIYYVFCGKNKATKIKPGQCIDLIYNLLYQFTDKFFVGFNGYFLQQIQNDKLSGKVILNSKERVMGSGFGALYKPSEKTYFAFHLYFESLARNRSQGINLILRWVQLF